MPATGRSLTAHPEAIKLQKAMAFVFCNLEADFFITIGSNDPRMNYWRARSEIKKLDALIDHYFLGKNWSRMPSVERALFAAVTEQRCGPPHHHILLRVPPSAVSSDVWLREFPQFLKTIHRRKKIFPRGDIDVKRITGKGDLEDFLAQLDIGCYLAKDLWKHENIERILISTEFHHAGEAVRPGCIMSVGFCGPRLQKHWPALRREPSW